LRLENFPSIYKIKLNKEIPIDMPILLQKFSSTYYQKVLHIPSQVLATLQSFSLNFLKVIKKLNKEKNKNDSEDAKLKMEAKSQGFLIF